MRQPRIYVDLPLKVGASLILAPEASHYLAQVLRLKAGDCLRPFNSVDGEFLATIETPSRKKTSITITDLSRQIETPRLSVNLGLGLSRGDRMDFAIQKSTEMGVSSLTPLYTEFSEVRFKQSDRIEKKMIHWRNIAISASEQSGRLCVPIIHAPRPISHWIDSSESQLRVILNPESDNSFGNLNSADNCDLLIGPEGGFSESEVSSAVAAGFEKISLGERILRTETAPIAALAVLQFRFGDLG